MLCLISASFTGCIEDDNDDTVTDTTDYSTSDETTDNTENTSETDDNENTTNVSEGADWTFMTYISDSDLEYFAIEDMIEMEKLVLLIM